MMKLQSVYGRIERRFSLILVTVSNLLQSVYGRIER